MKLEDSPIPANVITQGKPVAKTWVAAPTPDQKMTQGVWECTAGKFNWDYTWDEFVMVFEGEAIITPANGAPFTLRAGGFGYFPAGLRVD